MSLRTERLKRHAQDIHTVRHCSWTMLQWGAQNCTGKDLRKVQREIFRRQQIKYRRVL